jgi:hypothetical protein
MINVSRKPTSFEALKVPFRGFRGRRIMVND